MAFFCIASDRAEIEMLNVDSKNAFSTPESLPKRMIVQELFQSGNMDHVSISSFFDPLGFKFQCSDWSDSFAGFFF